MWIFWNDRKIRYSKNKRVHDAENDALGETALGKSVMSVYSNEQINYRLGDIQWFLKFHGSGIRP